MKVDEEIYAKNKNELIKNLSDIDIRVPRNREDRTNPQLEKWIMFKFLATQVANNKINYPSLLKKRERPDFVISEDGVETGFEVIEAINPYYLQATSLPEAKENKETVDIGLFKWGKTYKLEELRDIASRKKLSSGPWKGNSVEVEFSKIVFESTEKKTRVLNKSGYQKFENNSLLIYINQTLPVLDLNEGTDIANKKLESYWRDFNDTFDSVHVQVDGHIISFSKHGFESHKVNDLWSVKS